MADAAWFGNRVATGSLIVSGLALIVSAFAVAFSKRQANASEKQATEAEKSRLLTEKALAAQAVALLDQSSQTTKALDIAERNAKAVEGTLEATKILAETGQRAWIAFDEILSIGQRAGLLPSLVTIKVKNDGATPAKAELQYEWKLESQITDSMNFTKTPADFMIGPHIAIDVKCYIQLDQSQDVSIRKGEDRLLICARAVYEDVFGRRHKTDYCRQYHSQSGSFVPWKSFNSSD
jgi:hypothetical protein